MARKKRIVLSMDGGGIRGLIPLRLLESIESRMSHRGVRRPLHQCFDLMCGTSTGGLIAAAIAAPKPGSGIDEAAFSISDLRAFFERDTREIFIRSIGRTLSLRLTNPLGLFNENYDPRPLETWLKEHFGWTSLASALTPVVLTTYDIERRQAVFLTNGHAHDGAKADDFYIWQAVRAALATPGYLEPARVDNLSTGDTNTLIDAGIFLQNPVFSAYIEARKMGWEAEDIVILSLGSGHAAQKGFSFQEASNWGSHDWVRPSNGSPLLSIASDAQSRTASYQADCLFTDLGEARLIRIDGEIPAESEAIDNARPGNLIKLNGAADRIIRDNTILLDEVAELLITAAA
ncbi:patatin-like phospholipase family protein [Roseibium sp.]|uniref:patatin-like phospholipase family protein n=1 Tax=Roseibium sp. TaxID=1936156 RepID=UPI003A9836C4